MDLPKFEDWFHHNYARAPGIYDMVYKETWNGCLAACEPIIADLEKQLADWKDIAKQAHEVTEEQGLKLAEAVLAESEWWYSMYPAGAVSIEERIHANRAKAARKGDTGRES